MATIRKNSKVLKELWEKDISIKVYSLNNYFIGETVKPENLKRCIERIKEDLTWKSTSVSSYDGKLTVQIHSNLWYEISTN